MLFDVVQIFHNFWTPIKQAGLGLGLGLRLGLGLELGLRESKYYMTLQDPRLRPEPGAHCVPASWVISNPSSDYSKEEDMYPHGIFIYGNVCRAHYCANYCASEETKLDCVLKRDHFGSRSIYNRQVKDSRIIYMTSPLRDLIGQSQL